MAVREEVVGTLAAFDVNSHATRHARIPALGVSNRRIEVGMTRLTSGLVIV